MFTNLWKDIFPLPIHVINILFLLKRFFRLWILFLWIYNVIMLFFLDCIEWKEGNAFKSISLSWIDLGENNVILAFFVFEKVNSARYWRQWCWERTDVQRYSILVNMAVKYHSVEKKNPLCHTYQNIQHTVITWRLWEHIELMAARGVKWDVGIDTERTNYYILFDMHKPKHEYLSSFQRTWKKVDVLWRFYWPVCYHLTTSLSV